MSSLRFVLPTLGMAIAIAGATAYADTNASAAPAPSSSTDAASGHQWKGGRHRPGSLVHVLRQLNLTPEQQTQVRAIFARAKSDLQATHASRRDNRLAFAATAPTDPKYPALLATEKANAASRIQQASDIRAQVYAVLSPAQQAQIPAILAADQAAREARAAAWRAKHEPS